MTDWIVEIHDAVDDRIAGHMGSHYISPPQDRTSALALVATLVGPTPPDDRRDRWTLAIAGGRRTVALSPAP